MTPRLRQAVLYWHTLRYLKPVQVYGRLCFRMHVPRVPRRPTPRRRPPSRRWQAPVGKAASMLSADRFCFLNRCHRLPAQNGWNDEGLEKLWLYNLHYFDDLNAHDAQARYVWHLALMQRWVAENPPRSGNGWEPYPTSLRMVNWVKWVLAGGVLPEKCEASLAVQARWLRKRLEWHLLGNHLFANAKALVFAGLFFDGEEANQWLQTGLDIVARQLPEQVLPDGGNFERSPMYHAIFLEDLLDLINAAETWSGTVAAAVVIRWRQVAEHMLAWLQGMSHPDGEIGLFNDAAFGVAPHPAALMTYAVRLGVSPHAADRTAYSRQAALQAWHWPDSGYLRLTAPDATALLDVAEIGPPYLAAHGHADTLSFELSVHGHRVVVNGGTSQYGSGLDRLRERETVSHSTVEVAGASSSEVWGGFRAARRARPFDLAIREEARGLRVVCAHDGYTRLAAKPVHRREWLMYEHSLRVTDAVIGGQYPAVARFILHPAVCLQMADAGAWELALPGGQRIRVWVRVGSARIEADRYAPEFGKVLETRCLAVALTEGHADVAFEWT